MIKVRKLSLEGLLEVRVLRFEDERGFFAETYNWQEFERAGIGVRFVQDNHSFSPSRGVRRGLHYQLAPATQDKLVRVARGSTFDVAVDIRRSSPTFGCWTGLELSEKAGNQIFVPAGFAHGFVTLEDNTEVIYKVSAFYRRDRERAIRFDDPDIGIDWPLPLSGVRVSAKDRAACRLIEAEVFGTHELTVPA
jgi:dTDP-4-dehydrorhamnose 3,5-epimerase